MPHLETDMFRLLLLLISLPAFSADDTLFHTHVSGYSYYSHVVNEDFKISNGRTALNLSLHTDDVQVSSQISTHELDHVQRLDITIPVSVAPRHHGGFKIGRFDKSSWFFSQIVESPGSMGVRYLPQTVYNEAYVPSLSNFDGVQFFNTAFARDGNYRVDVKFSIGKPMMSEQRDIQYLMLDTDVLVDDIELVGDYDSYAANVSINLADTIDMFWEHSVYNAHFEQISQGDSPMEQMMVSTVMVSNVMANSDVWLRTTQLGMRVTPNSVYRVTGEYYLSNFSNPLINGAGWMLMGDYTISDDIQIFLGYGEDASDVDGLWSNRDMLLGVNQSFNDFFVVYEYHKNMGGSFTESGDSETSFILTVGYEF
jgi:hypothetical protein